MLIALPSPAIHAAVAGVVAAVALPAVLGVPSFPALAKGRLALTVLPSLAVGGLVFCLVLHFSTSTAE